MANNSVYRGTLQPLRQRLTEKWSPSGGFTSGIEWLGFGETEMRALAQQYADAGFEYEFVDQHGIFTLTGTDTSGNITIDTWEIGAQDEIVSSLKNPRNIAAIPAGYLELIGYALKKDVSIEAASAALEADTGDIYSDTIIGNAEAVRLYERLLKDQTGFLDSKYILRHTTNVGNRWGVNVADINVNAIYTTAQLLSETQNASSWVYPLPGRLAYKISNLSADAISRYGTLSAYQWGWLKSASPENTAANNRVNIVTEYKFDNWSTDEYATA